MDTGFFVKVRAAAASGWWACALGWSLIAAQYLLYLYVTSSRPAWLAGLWGPDLDWPFVSRVWFAATAALKGVVFLMLLASFWLTLWARALRQARH
jgi:hypothetical protein